MSGYPTSAKLGGMARLVSVLKGVLQGKQVLGTFTMPEGQSRSVGGNSKVIFTTLHGAGCPNRVMCGCCCVCQRASSRPHLTVVSSSLGVSFKGCNSHERDRSTLCLMGTCGIFPRRALTTRHQGVVSITVIVCSSPSTSGLESK